MSQDNSYKEVLKLLELKSHGEWREFLSSISKVIIENILNYEKISEKKFGQAEKDWSCLTLEEKIIYLQNLMDNVNDACIKGVFKLGALRLFYKSEWDSFSKKPSVEEDYDLTEYDYNGIFTYFKQHGNRHPVIVLNDEALFEGGFLDSVHLLGHELGHAMLGMYYTQFTDSISDYLSASSESWPSHACNALFLNMVIIHAEKYEVLVSEKKEVLEMLKAENTPENYKKYMAQYDEMLAEDFGDMLVQSLRSAIEAN